MTLYIALAISMMRNCLPVQDYWSSSPTIFQMWSLTILWSVHIEMPQAWQDFWITNCTWSKAGTACCVVTNQEWFLSKSWLSYMVTTHELEGSCCFGKIQYNYFITCEDPFLVCVSYYTFSTVSEGTVVQPQVTDATSSVIPPGTQGQAKLISETSPMTIEGSIGVNSMESKFFQNRFQL